MQKNKNKIKPPTTLVLCYLVAKGTRDIILSKDNINHGDVFCFFSLKKLLKTLLPLKNVR